MLRVCSVGRAARRAGNATEMEALATYACTAY